MVRLILFAIVLIVAFLIWAGKQAAGAITGSKRLRQESFRGQTQKTMRTTARGVNWLNEQWEQAKQAAREEREDPPFLSLNPEEQDRKDQEYMRDIQRRYEEIKEEAAKRPSQARTFNSEEEIEQSLGRMDPGAAEATRLLTQAWVNDPKGMQNKEQWTRVFLAACLTAIERVVNPPGGVSNADMLAFSANHEDEIRRVHHEIAQFYLRR